ncbi:hypothetical protein [Prosthecobacter dejongeii]|uniref:Uncharacterized protein n=1 Tax=Prosthecobacter dejongeii TaxID=48465 RepID=A0A7W8DQV4_9BACT|nr:hypothetical protein [Prosthecobacter dejongeii]MBB5038271.1 hypothetical protein [Prosthecobacter dejongeii]
MSAPRVIVYGEKCFRLEPDKRSERLRGLDAVYGHWQTDSPRSFRKGSVPPGYPHMRIKSCDTIDWIDGLDHEHRWEADGLLDGADKLDADRMSQPEEGWDVGTLAFLTVRPEAYVQHSSHPLYPSLVIQDLEKENLNGYVSRVSCSCRGIYIPKAVKRRYSTNSKEITVGATIPTISEYPQSYRVPQQRLQMTERFLIDGDPPTDKVGQVLLGADVPTDTPTIFSSALTAFVTSFQFNYPYLWRIDNLTAERLLAGRSEHDVTVQYSYWEAVEPNGAA